MLNSIIFGIFLLSFLITMTLVYLDYTKKRVLTRKPFVSFIVPTYNDSEFIGHTIQSIYSSYDSGYFEVIVANAKSTDDTLKVLNKLKKRFDFKIINHSSRIKKSESLNLVFEKARGEIIIIVDSDILLKRKNVLDLLVRLENKFVGAASCRYSPINNGFFPRMMELEYCMQSLLQESQNIYSTTNLWGGCLAVKKNVLMAVGGFSEEIIAEDTDLAVKIGKGGWRVEESPIGVLTYVPADFKTWYYQKIRWGAGYIETLFNNLGYFLKHPISLFFILTYSILTILFVVAAINNFLFIDNLFHLFELFSSEGYSFLTAWGMTKISAGISFFSLLGIYLLYPLFSLPYAILSIRKKTEIYKLFLIFPFSIVYYPIFGAVSLVGFVVGIKRYIGMKRKGLYKKLN